MNRHVSFSSLFLASWLAFATIPASAQQPQEPCDRSLADEVQMARQGQLINSLLTQLYDAYESGDKQKEEELTKRLVGYSNHREVTFSEDDKNKMAEIAQRPEVKAIIETSYAETRLEHTTQAHRYNLSPCFFYPNPMLQNYVNKLGQSLVPPNSSEFYSFRIVNDPRLEAWTLSTGSVYVTTGMVASLDNEAQLAYVLAHEIGHVELRHAYLKNRDYILENLLEAEKVRSAKKKGAITGAIAGGILGGALGGGKSAATGVLAGAALGYGVADVIMKIRGTKLTDFSRTQEAEADEFAMRAVLEHNFDAREAPKLLVGLQGSVHRDNRTGLGFAWGNTESLMDRRQNIQTLLAGALKADLEQRSKGGLQTTSPDFSLLMSEVKRDNGALALDYDLFEEARQNLEESIALRSTDPIAHYYLGQAYKVTAHSAADSQKAMDHLMQAIRLDTTRSAYDNPHLERAAALLAQNDPTVFGEAQKEIRTYVELYKVNHGGVLPRNMSILYDYLSLTGDDNWSEVSVLNVSQMEKSQSTDTAKPEPKRESTKRSDQARVDVKKAEATKPK